MNSTRIVKAVDRLKWSTKLVFGLLLKLILLLIWGLSSFLKGGLLMSGYKIIMIILGILSVMISFGALVALICLEIAK